MTTTFSTEEREIMLEFMAYKFAEEPLIVSHEQLEHLINDVMDDDGTPSFDVRADDEGLFLAFEQDGILRASRILILP